MKLSNILKILIPVLLLVFSFAPASFASLSAGYPSDPEKFALVVGIADYGKLNQLKNPVRDANAVAASLEKSGFKVTLVTDVSGIDFHKTIANYQKSLPKHSLSLFYYAGHGAEVDGRNYLLGADADVNSAIDLENQSVILQAEFDTFHDGTSTQVHIFALDTNRENPFAEKQFSVKQSSPAPVNTIMLYSTIPGGFALDGNGDISPFAAAMVELLQTSDIDIGQLGPAIRTKVIDATDGQQVPSFKDSNLHFIKLNPTVTPEVAEVAPLTKAAGATFESEDGTFEPTYADGSYALLVGQSDYGAIGQDPNQPWRDLPAVRGELDRMADVLENVHGFIVEKAIDLNGDALEKTIETFVNTHGAKPNARLFIMMSGHGATTEAHGQKVAWFVPKDAPALIPRAPFQNTALPLRRIEEWSEVMEAKHVLWVFDSCFSGTAIRMIAGRGSSDAADGWTKFLHENPVRRVITAGSENEEVPATSRFTERLIEILSGEQSLGEAGPFITGDQIGEFLRRDLVEYTFKNRLDNQTPQNDTIVLQGEKGDIIFRIEPTLSAQWLQKNP
jgi:uncharacterized caspase-like protein